jgi:nucleoside 2-deoxyribosyltransferase
MTNTATLNSKKTFLDSLQASVAGMVRDARADSVGLRYTDRDYFYLAGGLFNNEQLLGNLLLSSEIVRLSGQKVLPDLPQNKESNTDAAARHPHNIRAKDLEGVLLADVALFMFEGMNLDEGMLIEFGFAKALGMPTVVVRTDFRKAGDQEGNVSENWNLMCSDFPQHGVVTTCSIADYGAVISRDSAGVVDVMESLYTPVAGKVLSEFAALRSKPPTISGPREFLIRYYKSIINAYDGSGKLGEAVSQEELVAVVDRKIQKGLLGVE